jgi:predicted dienelactone hydrolase
VYPNAIDLSATGELEVAVLGGGSADVSDLDPDSATLSDPEVRAEVRALEAGTARDVDGDGRVDAILRFSVPALKKAGVLTPGTTRVLLRARTRGGADLVAWDTAHDATHPVARLPRPTGPHAVGTFEDAWTDARREEPLTPVDGDPRELKVRFWYPARPHPQAQPAPYFLSWREGELAAEQAHLDPRTFGFVFPHAVRDAALLEGGERFPVLLFSHGYAMATAMYGGVAEELASHGYVVVAISHTRGSSPLVFADGRVVDEHVELSFADPALNTRVQNLWTADARFVLDQLEQLDAADPSGRFTARLDLTRVGMFGHSFGGSTAAEACRTDSRVKAGLNMDGTFFGDLTGEVRVPFLLMSSDGNEQDPTRARFFQQLRATGYAAHLRGSGHIAFSDITLLLPLFQHFAPGTRPEDLALGSLEGPRMASLMNTYVRAFFDTHLRERPTPLLERASPEHPEVELTVHAR